MTTFGNIPDEFADPEQAAVYLTSIPYDDTSTWGKGADRGFEAFLDAAANMELYDIETDSEVYRRGICLRPPVLEDSSPEAMCDAVYRMCRDQLDTGKFLTFFGGEHSVSIGLLRAHRERFPDLTVLQIDAHADLRPEYEGSACNHACALHEAGRAGNLIQVGIRSMDVSEKAFLDPDRCWFDHQMHGNDDWMDASIDRMTDPVYLTLDFDALNPAIFPATGTPEPGGLDWHTLVRYLKKVITRKDLVGFDLVELAPIEGLRAPQFLAAKLYYKLLSYHFHVTR